MATIPSLDHYYGRQVEDMGLNPEGEEGWYVELTGGVRIINTNPEYELPDESLMGTMFAKSELSSEMTRLWFGTDDNPLRTVMHLDPTTYQISDPTYNGGERVSPQTASLEFGESMDKFESSAPGERQVEGPSEDYLAEQERVRAEAETEEDVEP